MKGVAMSAGRHWIKELYVGFLLLLLSFLYLSHLNAEYQRADLQDQLMRIQRNQPPMAAAKIEASSFSFL